VRASPPFPFVLCHPSCLYVVKRKKRKKRKGGQGGGCCVPPPPVFLAPVVVIFLQWNSASDYFSGSVHAYTRTESTIPLPACYMRLPDVVASFDGISQHLTCIPPLSPFLTPYLATPPRDVKTYFCSMSLCYAYAYAYAIILRSASPPLSLTSLPVLSATCLQQDVCRRLILGYNRWYLSHFHAILSCPYLQCHIHFANLLNLCGGGRVMVVFFFILRGLAKLLFRIRQSRRLHDRPGRRWQVARVCLPHVRRSGFG